MSAIETGPAPEADAAADAAADRQARGRTGSGALETFSIRNRTTGEQAARRAALMRRLRVALPALAIVLVAAFLLNTRRDGADDAFLDDFADIGATAEGLQSKKPRFSGVDAEGAPYDITADSATQNLGEAKIYKLDRPRAESRGASETSAVEANSGVYDQDAKRLDLGDGVIFRRAIGRDNYVLKTPAATINVDDQTLVSDKGVDGEGPGGAALKADRVAAEKVDGKVVFEGNVSMRIYPRKTPEPASGKDEQ
jgi:lipopolysaccharide export system protein LptC